MKRKVAVTLLCGVLAISSLAGCGNTQIEETEPVVAEEPAVEEETPLAEDGPAEEVTEETDAEESEQEEEEKFICLTQTDYNADGSVVTLTKYIYSESGGTLKEIAYGADGSVKSSIENELDENGFCIKSTTYDADGNITESTEHVNNGIVGNSETGSTMGWTTYDADGNVISSYLSEDEFDDNGNQIKSTYSQINNYDGDCMTFGGVTEYEYDDNNRQTKMISYEEDGSTIQYIYEYAYDSAGNCITETKYDADGAVSSTKDKEYDSDNNVIKETETNADGTGYMLTEYEYDSRGNQIKMLTSCNYDYYTSNSLSEFEYDTNDRQVRQTYYSEGALQSISCKEYDNYGNISRAITYYTEESEYQVSQITEYEYIELQDYLTAKKSIDEEETTFVNTEPIETILSGLGISDAESGAVFDETVEGTETAGKILNINLSGDPKSHVSEVAFRTAPDAEWMIITPTGTTPTVPMPDSDRDLFYLGTLENYSLPGDYLAIRVKAVLQNGEIDNTEYTWTESGDRLSNVPSGSDCLIHFDHIAGGIFIDYYDKGAIIDSNYR